MIKSLCILIPDIIVILSLAVSIPAGLAGNSNQGGLTLVINELMASNTSTIKDSQGEYDDWIEIYNAGQSAIDMGGMYLADDLSTPTKWQIPVNNPSDTTILSHGYLLIWADNPVPSELMVSLPNPVEGDTADSDLHANFKLDADGGEVGLFDRDGVTLIDSITFAQQTADISYGRYPDAGDTLQFMVYPTPNAPNNSGYLGAVDEPQFSHSRGFYDEPFSVSLTTTTEGAVIYYTLDGSVPMETGGRFTTGTVYTNPISITQTTCLRAKAIKDGWMSSKVETHTYIFINDVVHQSPTGARPGPSWPSGNVSGQIIDYGMDPDVVNDPRYIDLMDDALLAIPTISFVTSLKNLFDAATGIYVHSGSEGLSWERPVSVELLNPDGSDGFQINAGLRIRGGYSRQGANPKHAFRLFFRPEYGQAKLKYPLFGDEGVDEFENLDLRCSQNYSWSFEGSNKNTEVREVFSRDLQGEMGHPYTRSRYYHLYINGQYWGLYQSQERSEASYAESYMGGDKDDYDVVKSDTRKGYSMIATDGNMDAYRRLYDATLAGLRDNAAYYRVQGKNPDGTPNPSYERLLDIDNLIDFMIIEYYTADRDGPGSRFVNRPNNVFGIYNRRNPDGWKWFQHDSEHSLGAFDHSLTSSSQNLVTPFTTAGAQWLYFNPHWLHEQLISNNADYRMHFVDHVYRHFFNDGLCTAQASTNRFLARAGQIELAIIAESARWGDAKRHPPFTKDDAWLPEINWVVNTYLPTRTTVVLNQFKSVSWPAQAGWYPNIDPPTFTPRGGLVPSGFTLQLMAARGTIYYTLDGSDPRLLGASATVSSISPSAVRYAGSVTMTKSSYMKSRILDGSTWSALNEAVFAVGPVAENLRITEIMYHPQDGAADADEEYIELKNIGTEIINLNLVRFTPLETRTISYGSQRPLKSLTGFTDGIDFTFGDVALAAGGYTLIVKDRNIFTVRYGTNVNIAGQYSGSLSDAGERIRLEDAVGNVILDFEYSDGWRSNTDGGGFSLTIIDATNADLNSWGQKGSWQASLPSPGM